MFCPAKYLRYVATMHQSKVQENVIGHFSHHMPFLESCHDEIQLSCLYFTREQLVCMLHVAGDLGSCAGVTALSIYIVLLIGWN